VLIIDPDGLFNGDRLRRCSNVAQLHWPRLFLASDGFGRLEINYARIIGHAYPTFSPVPSEAEIQSYLQEYARNFLLFLYQADGRLWGQWDAKPALMPRYKTSIDRRSPQPPEKEFLEWKRSYLAESKSFPKSFGNISETFQHVGVENSCSSKNDEPISAPQLLAPREGRSPEPSLSSMPDEVQGSGALDRQFAEFYQVYPHKKDRAAAKVAYVKALKVTSHAKIMDAVRRQLPELIEVKARGFCKYPARWLNAGSYDDSETTVAAVQPERRIIR
jgi:hypothetical protein